MILKMNYPDMEKNECNLSVSITVISKQQNT